MAFAAPLIGAGASILGGVLGKGASKKAQAAQTAAINQATAEQRRQYDITRADNLPWLTAGQGALGQQQGLLGLQGGDIQSQLIAQLKGSPAFTSLYDTGADTILQSAAATGGLRGGNLNNSLAQFSSGLLSTAIQNQLQNLGGLSGMGQQAGATLGQFGANSTNQIAQLLQQQGNVNAAGIGQRAGMLNNTINGLAGIAGNVFAPGVGTQRFGMGMGGGTGGF